jgi:hypothetical protein
MIFDQNRGSERSWTNIDPVGVTILLPSEDFVLLNHSTFKPFECYSDRLLARTILSSFKRGQNCRRRILVTALARRLTQHKEIVGGFFSAGETMPCQLSAGPS